MIKIKDLLNYLEKQNCEIDKFYLEYLGYWIENLEQEGGSRDKILEMEINDRVYRQIYGWIMSYFETEFGNIMYDVGEFVKKGSK